MDTAWDLEGANTRCPLKGSAYSDNKFATLA